MKNQRLEHRDMQFICTRNSPLLLEKGNNCVMEVLGICKQNNLTRKVRLGLDHAVDSLTVLCLYLFIATDDIR